MRTRQQENTEAMTNENETVGKEIQQNENETVVKEIQQNENETVGNRSISDII